MVLQKMKIICQLGSAFSDYREKIYRNGFSGKQKVKIRRKLRSIFMQGCHSSIYPVPPTLIAAVSISPLITEDAAAPTDGLSPDAGVIVTVGGELKPRPR